MTVASTLFAQHASRGIDRLTDDVELIDEAHLGLARNLTLVFAGVGAAHAAQVKRPRVRVRRVVHLVASVADERVRIDREQMTVPLADPRDLEKGGET